MRGASGARHSHEQACAYRGSGRIRDRLRRGCPDGRQFALFIPKGDDRDPKHGQRLSQAKYSPPTHTGSAGHVPRRRHRGADVSDQLIVDCCTRAL